MNLIKTFVISITLYLCSMNSLEAKLKIPVGPQEILLQVHDLPDTEDFLIEEGHYLDLATLHEEYIIAFIPLWVTKDAILVGYDKIDKTYYEIEDDRMEVLLSEQKLNKASLIGIPFWNKFGGKLVALAIIALIIYGYIPSKKKKVESQEV